MTGMLPEGKLAKRRTLTGLNPLLESVLAGAVGLLVGIVIMVIYGYNPWAAVAALFSGAYGNAAGFANTLAKATPLLLTALTFSVCMRAGMFNIGAEGQLFMGTLAAVAIGFVPLPEGWGQIVRLIAAMLAGALWGFIPALLKVTRGVSEVISTIMFNWIARWLALYLVLNILFDPLRAEKTINIPVAGRLPLMMARTNLSLGFPVAVAFALILYFVVWHTVVGYEIRAAGLNPDAAKYGGINSRRTMLLSFILGGMGAGLAGACYVMGTPPTYAVFAGMPELTNLGFDGMAVAMVGRNHPIGIIFSAIFFGGLTAGGRVMQFRAGVPLDMVRAVNGAIVLAMAIPELVRILPMARDCGRRILSSLRGGHRGALHEPPSPTSGDSAEQAGEETKA